MNVLLGAWDGEFGLPPFAEISDADFSPAFEAALTEARANIAAITEAAEVTFAAKTAGVEACFADRLRDVAVESGDMTNPRPGWFGRRCCGPQSNRAGPQFWRLKPCDDLAGFHRAEHV